MTRRRRTSEPDCGASSAVEFIDPPAEPSAVPPGFDVSPDAVETSVYSPRFVAAAPPDPAAVTCIRLNCREHGRPTSAARCPACGHPTLLLRDHRWPRSVLDSLQEQDQAPWEPPAPHSSSVR